jgi:hypothetical protein
MNDSYFRHLVILRTLVQYNHVVDAFIGRGIFEVIDLACVKKVK